MAALPEGKIHPVDEFVGDRLRQRRKKLKMSQTALGKLVGVSFQQIQKYENGQNRIPASKLFEFAEVLNAPVTYFYDGIEVDESDLEISLDGAGRIRFRRSAPLNVLIAEHDPADVARLQSVLGKIRFKTKVCIVNNGVKAKEFLRNKKGTNPFTRPDIIITALKLPRIDGLTLIKDIKRDRDLKLVPVIVLTNSMEVSDMVRAYKAQAAGFIPKSADDDEFRQRIEECITYWANAVILPSM